MASAERTVWIDVDDLFHYVAHNARLSGIQRLTYELYSAIEQQAGSFGLRSAYLRIDPALDEFVVVNWQDVRRLCHGLTTDNPLPDHAHPSPSASGARDGVLARARAFSRHAALYVNHRLPETAREPFARFRTLQLEALRSLAQMRRAGVGTVRHAASQIARRADVPTRLLDVAQPGDWLLSLGAPWHRVDYGRLVECARREAGLHTGLLLYDLIPLLRPEWCHRSLVETFGAWLNGILPQCDALFAISDATARDVSSLLRARGRADPVVTMPVGTGFPASKAATAQVLEPVPDHAVPKPGSYVLFVSTIEARKNHALMFQVWRRLAEIMPPEQLPTLVFAGRIGWLVSDLMTQIANTNYCDGKLQIIEDPSDAVLMRLYEGCLFTVLPSLFEGWGLPVTESLSFGKPCVTSDNTSLPEAGAGLTRMLDPYDLNDATRVIHEILSDRDALADWQEQVRNNFVPVPWTRSADAILGRLSAEAVDLAPVLAGSAA